MERLYLGFMATICFTIGLFNFKQNQNRIIQGFYLINTILCAIFILTVSARIAMISILMIGLIKVFYVLNIKKSLISMAVLILMIAVVFKVNPNLKSRFFYPKNDEQSYLHKLKEWEPRYVIWTCSYYIFNSNESPFFGNGFQNTQNKLNECYESSISKKGRREWFLKKGYNTHNQFIDFILSTGVFGFVLFSLLLIMLLVYSKNKIININLIIILLLFLMVENILHRQIGVYLFSLLIIFINKENVTKNKTKPLVE